METPFSGSSPYYYYYYPYYPYPPSHMPMYYEPSSSPSPSSSSRPVKKKASTIRRIPISDGTNSKSKSKLRSQSALKIQKVFRGFRVRKNVNKITTIRREVEEIENKFHQRETLELIRRDSKERLKVTESLMTLLLKLDSVNGVDHGVRVLRKAVIKKAIVLQEMIDFIVNTPVNNAVSVVADNPVNVDDAVNEGEIAVDGGGEFLTENAVNEVDVGVSAIDDPVSEENLEVKKMEDEAWERTTDDAVHGGDMGFSKTDNVVNEEENSILEKIDEEAWECVGEETEQKSDVVDSNEVKKGGDSAEPGSDEWCDVGKEEERKKSKENLLEKMVENNEKLMLMVSDLCQKNATQARLISSLSQRVENLEKAMNERLLRKKKKMIKNVLNATLS